MDNYILQYSDLSSPGSVAKLPKGLTVPGPLPSGIICRYGRGKFWFHPADPWPGCPCVSLPAEAYRDSDLPELLAHLGHLSWQTRYPGAPVAQWERAQRSGGPIGSEAQKAMAELHDWKLGIRPGPKAPPANWQAEQQVRGPGA